MSSPSQPTISSYFSPPARRKGSTKASPIDLTTDDDEPPRKKLKVASRDSSTPPLKARPKAKASAATRRKSKPVSEEVEELSGDESDPQFKALTAMFKQKKTVARRDGKALVKPKVQDDIGPSGQSYTPLEKQVLQLKKENGDALLMIKVGYKYKFFGDDAKVAAKELGMIAFEDRNFLVASIPDHRRDIHLKNLLSRGYKVGVVEQTETAALKKVGDNRNAPFDRKLARLYTAATYVDDLDSVDDTDKYVSPPFLCLVEEQQNEQKDRVKIGMISVSPRTGDITWDEFEDDSMRLELETRFSYIKPAELLVCKDNITKSTAKILTHYTTNLATDTRVEYCDSVMSYTYAFSFVTDFYQKKRQQGAVSAGVQSGQFLAEVSNLPKQVVVALAHTMSHLAAFGLSEVLSDTQFYRKFTTQSHMLLATNTLHNLEIYENQTDFTSKGTLMSVLDRTRTAFGARMLKTWVGRPLTNKEALQERIDAVQEIIASSEEKLVSLRQVLKGLPDLSKGLCRIQFGQASPNELAVILKAFQRIADSVEPTDSAADVGFQSPLLNDVIYSLQHVKKPITEILSVTSIKRLTEKERHEIWLDKDRYPDLEDQHMAILQVESELEAELKNARKTLKFPSLQFSTIAGDECLLEIKRSENRPIPDNWILVSRTKTLARYHTPAVKQKLEERSQRQESLDAEAIKAFREFLSEIHDKYYGVLRSAVNSLAIGDCLLSLALVGLQPGYVKPDICDDGVLEIVNGRHPMVETLSSDPFIPNSVCIGGTEGKIKIITGPNMGGKSSCVRMVALIAIMAQIGSYVPADAVRMGLLDAVHTRMGASDDMLRGRSTFMVEMAETSDILQTATENSLVILDELGRGTSTFDGMAIAHAVLQYLNDIKRCKTLFITHYPAIALDLEKKYSKAVQNLHMGYQAEARINGTREITFLYTLTNGVADESFGVECGRLAGLPEKLLRIASESSEKMKDEVAARMRRNR
ncbi:hypothetical protein BDZ89DRAFT_1005971 [Hymenopellis radicata]|nr:hypothetical protein BDZ89DRAFT_1005971 [Hymenopellis radicata]